MANRLQERRDRIVGPSDGFYTDARQNHDEWKALLREWGELNDIKVSSATFGPRKLAGLKVRSRGFFPEDVYDALGFPGRDHDTRFHRRRRPAAIVTEPYHDNDGLQEYADTLGLVLHSPPNPKASFWYPGQTLFIVITRHDFGKVQWLPDQLAFRDS